MSGAANLSIGLGIGSLGTSSTGGSGTPPFVFTDDFNRINQNLEADTDWTRVDGIEGGATVDTNQLAFIDAASNGSTYVCPDIGSPNMYVQARLKNVSVINFGIVGKMLDQVNFMGFRRTTGGNLQFQRRLAGSFGNGHTGSVLALNDVVRMEIVGTSVRLLINGVQDIAPFEETNFTSITRAGVTARNTAANPAWDDFEAGPL